ncbi:MAG TPA: 50S ribosome-binding GTPase [bacterium]|nr:50S ribosome-binding GTPase [bacterium]
MIWFIPLIVKAVAVIATGGIAAYGIKKLREDDDCGYDDDNDEITTYNSERKVRQMSELIDSFKSQMTDFDIYIKEKNFKMSLDYISINDERNLESFLKTSHKKIFTFDNTWEARLNRLNIKKERYERVISILADAMNNPESLRKCLNELVKTENQTICRKLQRVLEKYEDNEINVVNIGKLKAGKSSLFNILADKPELFATGKTRKTVEIQSFSSDSIRFTDTPGTDCYEEDSEKAFDATTGADILIYAVSGMKGTIDAQDRSVIEKALFELPEKGKGRLIAVITRIDALKDEEEIKIVKTNIRKQINKIAGFNVPVFTSSSVNWFERSTGESHPAEKFRAAVFKMAGNIKKELSGRKNRDVFSKIDDIVAIYENNLEKAKESINEFEQSKMEIEKEVTVKLKTILRGAWENLKRIENI